MATAQELLDRLHTVDIPFLFNVTLEKRARLDHIKLAKQKLRMLKRELKDSEDQVKRLWDGRNAYEAVREGIGLLPYQAIRQLVEEAELSISELEIALKNNAEMGQLETPVFPEIVLDYFSGSNYVVHCLPQETALEKLQSEGNALGNEIKILRERRDAISVPPGWPATLLWLTSAFAAAFGGTALVAQYLPIGVGGLTVAVVVGFIAIALSARRSTRRTQISHLNQIVAPKLEQYENIRETYEKVKQHRMVMPQSIKQQNS